MNLAKILVRTVIKMTEKECNHNCAFSIDGRCRLENVHGIKKPQCPFREGNLNSFSVS